MNLYLVERIDKIGLDEYDSMVVSAETEQRALEMPPSWSGWGYQIPRLKCTLIGISLSDVEQVILSRLNAG